MAKGTRDLLEARKGVDRGRHAREGAGSITYTILVLLAVAAMIAVSSRVRTSWDFTVTAANSLSPKTLEMLSKLKDDVDVKALFTDKATGRPGAYELLTRYRDGSDHLRYEFIDPVAKPGAVKDLGVDLDQAGARRDGIIIVIRGERKAIVREASEEAVTNAILDVGSDTPRVVGILRGYGEADPASGADGGFRAAVEALRAENYVVRDVLLADGVPPDVTVCIAVALKQDVPPADLARLEAWISGGGRLLAMTDPGQDHGLARLLEKFGLRPTGDQVLEPQENQNRAPEFVRVGEYSKHAITRGFGRNRPTAFPLVGSVTHFEPGDPEVFHQSLAVSSRASYSMSAQGKREQGPFDLAAASWKRLKGTGRQEREIRIVLVGDGDFASNAYLPVLHNRNFFLNCVGWLAQAEGLVTIRREKLEGQTITLEGGDRPKMLAMLFGAPVLVIACGIVVFLRRRAL